MIIIIEIILFVLGTISVVAGSIDDAKNGFFVFIGVILLLACMAIFYSDGYKNGQIDAANGIQVYKLVKDETGETHWTYKAKNEK